MPEGPEGLDTTFSVANNTTFSEENNSSIPGANTSILSSANNSGTNNSVETSANNSVESSANNSVVSGANNSVLSSANNSASLGGNQSTVSSGNNCSVLSETTNTIVQNLDNEFLNYIQFARPLVLSLRYSTERYLAAKWLQRFLNETSTTEQALELRNSYLKLLLYVLHYGVLDGPFKNLPPEDELPPVPNKSEIEKMVHILLSRKLTTDFQRPEYRVYYDQSFDRKIVSFVQPIPKFGVHAYFAVSHDPVEAWTNTNTLPLTRQGEGTLESSIQSSSLQTSGGSRLDDSQHAGISVSTSQNVQNILSPSSHKTHGNIAEASQSTQKNETYKFMSPFSVRTGPDSSIPHNSLQTNNFQETVKQGHNLGSDNIQFRNLEHQLLDQRGLYPWLHDTEQKHSDLGYDPKHGMWRQVPSTKEGELKRIYNKPDRLQYRKELESRTHSIGRRVPYPQDSTNLETSIHRGRYIDAKSADNEKQRQKHLLETLNLSSRVKERNPDKQWMEELTKWVIARKEKRDNAKSALLATDEDETKERKRFLEAIHVSPERRREEPDTTWIHKPPPQWTPETRRKELVRQMLLETEGDELTRLLETVDRRPERRIREQKEPPCLCNESSSKLEELSPKSRKKELARRALTETKGDKIQSQKRFLAGMNISPRRRRKNFDPSWLENIPERPYVEVTGDDEYQSSELSIESILSEPMSESERNLKWLDKSPGYFPELDKAIAEGGQEFDQDDWEAGQLAEMKMEWMDKAKASFGDFANLMAEADQDFDIGEWEEGQIADDIWEIPGSLGGSKTTTMRGGASSCNESSNEEWSAVHSLERYKDYYLDLCSAEPLQMETVGRRIYASALNSELPQHESKVTEDSTTDKIFGNTYKLSAGRSGYAFSIEREFGRKRNYDVFPARYYMCETSGSSIPESMPKSYVTSTSSTSSSVDIFPRTLPSDSFLCSVNTTLPGSIIESGNNLECLGKSPASFQQLENRTAEASQKIDRNKWKGNQISQGLMGGMTRLPTDFQRFGRIIAQKDQHFDPYEWRRSKILNDPKTISSSEIKLRGVSKRNIVRGDQTEVLNLKTNQILPQQHETQLIHLGNSTHKFPSLKSGKFNDKFPSIFSDHGVSQAFYILS